MQISAFVRRLPAILRYTLSEHGLDIAPDKEDKTVAAGLAVEYAEDPRKTSKK